ncbi:uncharacterized protein PGTG_09492 [Puccinia graminis f. sp. tritici CRL 75-36-700-3]|uniref:Protein bir1 n=1 Tax=Puccinia graminis f. sp. tritici (strain CRL 75-36-700-3 / race SCCL) TaxID=418459 RepID=E3KHK4_PUCGT|nr:uncharacterized protein PGTG_09492 [Puccinia graminis f. sp. tritici CRL 75-36-700-3]EFP83779.2 hypothetical protein PGTG_09492 [Puccinia graminis f. sp. tritici CRL 75-36-700-3]
MEENINMAGLRPEFCSHSARVMSFKSKKTLPKASRWPHPQSFSLTAEVLASAGYFHDPADNEPDRTTCWMCGESMKGWAEDDDPWELHLTWSSKCPFARIALLEHQRDTQKPSWSDSPTQSWGPSQEWFPRGSTMIEARLATFCGPDGPWKHEGKNGIPTRLELARAGFHFTPNLFKKGRKFDVDDTTSCCYCHRSVTEWEVDDDPVSVHLKKGACIFFTAVQPTENAKKANGKQTKKPSKTPDSGLSNSIKASAADLSAAELHGDSVMTEKSSRSKKKASTAPKTGRRVLASSISGSATAANESMVAESEDSVIHQKPTRASRKAPPAPDVPRSPEPVAEQSVSKPPVALGKSTRLSRSTSKGASAPTSNRSTTSNTVNRPRTRASSNASSTIDNITRQTINRNGEDQSQSPTEDEEPVVKPKKTQRQKKPTTKPSQPSSVLGSETEDHRPVRQMSRSQNTIVDQRELSTVGRGDESKVEEEEEISNKKTRVPGRKKGPISQSLRSEAPPQVAPNKKLMKSPEIHSPEGDQSTTRPKALMPSLFPGFNPQAPQLYPTLLTVAAKRAASTARPTGPAPLEKSKPVGPKELAPSRFPGFHPQAPPLDSNPVPVAAKKPAADSTAGPRSPPGAEERRAKAAGRQDKEEEEEEEATKAPATVDQVNIDGLLKEYLAREPGTLPEGWLPNPYNPSRPFPPLTEEEGQMPLNEYFAYRARQEEEAFVQWVDEKILAPWLAAVEDGQLLLQSFVDLRKSQRPSNKNLKQIPATSSSAAAAAEGKENKRDLNSIHSR